MTAAATLIGSKVIVSSSLRLAGAASADGLSALSKLADKASVAAQKIAKESSVETTNPTTGEVTNNVKKTTTPVGERLSTLAKTMSKATKDGATLTNQVRARLERSDYQAFHE
jgi:hypothetical protein